MNLVRDRVTTFASDRLVDLTGVTHATLREGLRNGDDALRNQVVRRESRRDIENALNFAYGIDPSGRRLPLVSDHLPIEQLRRATVARDRHDPRVAAVYARADRFDDGQPNVRVLTGNHALVPEPERIVGSPRKQTSVGKTTRVRPASEGSRSSSASSSATSSPTSSGGSTRYAASASRRSTVQGRSSKQSTSAQSKVTVGTAEAVAGATALKLEIGRSESGQEKNHPNLRLVGRTRRSGGQILVISFWTTFVVVMMFTAVVMWAQNTTGSVELERVNKRLAEAEGTYTQLRVEVARLQSPQRIESEATRLGLSTPLNITFVDPNNSGTIAPRR